MVCSRLLPDGLAVNAHASSQQRSSTSPAMSQADIKLSIRSDISLVPFVGRALSAMLAASGMTQSRVSSFELAVVEVVTNSIEHGCNNEENQKIDLLFTLTGESVEVSVRDNGDQLPSTVIERYTSAEAAIEVPDVGNIAELPESGWGTSLVATLCDEVRYEHTQYGNTLTLVCYLDDSNSKRKIG